MTPEMRQAMSKIEQSVTEKREEAVKEYDLAEHAERRNISVREKLVEHYEVLAQKEKILEHLSAIARLYEKLDDEAGRNATQVQIDRVSASNQASPERPKSPYGPYEQAQRRAPAPPQ
jgi:hypothetical protein